MDRRGARAASLGRRRQDCGRARRRFAELQGAQCPPIPLPWRPPLLSSPRVADSARAQCSLLSLFGDLFDEKDPLWPESCSSPSARETESDNPAASLPPPTPLAEVYMLSMGCSVVLASISICVTRLRSPRS